MTGRPHTWQTALLTVAVLWGLALPILAWLVPVYDGESVVASSDGTGAAVATSATMVGVDGMSVLATMSVPAVVAVAVVLVLRLRKPSAGPGAIAWILVGLLGATNLLAMLSIGVFVLPVTACLVAACVIRAAGAGSIRATPVRGPR